MRAWRPPRKHDGSSRRSWRRCLKRYLRISNLGNLSSVMSPAYIPQLRSHAEEVGARLEAATADKATLAAKLAAADEARHASRDTIKPLVQGLTFHR